MTHRRAGSCAVRRSWAIALGLVSFLGCRAEERRVVVYASIDQVHAEPLLRRFETRTGIRVLPVFDVEASKTTGRAQRELAELLR